MVKIIGEPPSHEGAPAFGFLADTVPDHAYPLGLVGFLFASPWVSTGATVRHVATILVSATGRCFDVESDGRHLTTPAALVPPSVRRRLRAFDVALISCNVAPHHPCYPWLRSLMPAGVVPLDRAGFGFLQHEMLLAYHGALSAARARALFEDLVAEAVSQSGMGWRTDTRPAAVLDVLAAHPDAAPAELARWLGVPSARVGRLVYEGIGVPFPLYRAGRRLAVAAEAIFAGARMTDAALTAGFADSAHLSRTWKRKFGMPPSYMTQRRWVQVVR
ncbi:AraC family transcriptional regulator [Caldimonas brevitalea]|uniref:Transcriptional regulator, AraC family n=1 Tax=Caldimonas brevitalea TaxID=413882 RepID=A0A0G3BMF6_9BURK|nr:AraC family transcriptional regulator [Caldimonas brevitalea]AKJ29163.1 transcriptional regulator, AraC family [Caldimonas brevitalea]